MTLGSEYREFLGCREVEGGIECDRTGKPVGVVQCFRAELRRGSFPGRSRPPGTLVPSGSRGASCTLKGERFLHGNWGEERLGSTMVSSRSGE